ncbi:molybdenum cofactor biosynthesis protein MoaE [Tsuneonella rigui]|uniref:molybdenum cofactor biosynthesis protein MoaE n=1 Tax=Tsuneonella rigui TaxID=1708790 RepID=UPI000F7DBC3B|nr:molybdenum cofactor biosynthesis protein MoaE [Tsuneonella rigui]
MRLDIRLLDEPFAPDQAFGAFTVAFRESGGIASFVGHVRPGNGVTALELSHYEPLTLPGMEELARAALARWPLDGLLLWHRVGVMRPGEPIVLVAAAAKHRRAAIEAVDFVMDHLKSAAWFWKREQRSGEWHWIEPRPEDHADLARWST